MVLSSPRCILVRTWLCISPTLRSQALFSLGLLGVAVPAPQARALVNLLPGASQGLRSCKLSKRTQTACVTQGSTRSAGAEAAPLSGDGAFNELKLSHHLASAATALLFMGCSAVSVASASACRSVSSVMIFLYCVFQIG